MKTQMTDAAPRPSAAIEADLNALAAQRADAEATVTQLAAQYDADLLQGDAAANANEVATTAAKRNIRRIELAIPEIEDELRGARVIEHNAERDRARIEAIAAVSAVVAEADADYIKPARQIAEFLKRYDAAAYMARDAGVQEPHAILRCSEGTTIPERVEDYRVYFDESGNETDNPHRPGAFSINADGQKLDPTRVGRALPERRSVVRQRIIPASYKAGRSLQDLLDTVRLPAMRIDDDDFWVGKHTRGEGNRRR